MNIDAKKFNIITMVLAFFLLGCMALTIIIIDPFFHYHAPINGIAYELSNERYQNNGIVKHFRYDAIITGTSMTENFKTSEMNRLFGTNAIKVPYSAGEYKEINDNLTVALESNKEVKVVLIGVDFINLLHDKDTPFYKISDISYQYPWYIVDDNFFTDVNYIFNKSTFFESIDIGSTKGEITSFDVAYCWGDRVQYGRVAVLSSKEAEYYYEDKPVADIQRELNDDEIERMFGNIGQNILETIENYPNVEFYLFIPPYSICFWDIQIRKGNFNMSIEAMQLLTEKLVQYDNVKLFAFWNNYEIVTDLDNYMDIYHYSPDVNSRILQWMAQEDEKYLLTKNNYREYWDEIREFYLKYNYDTIFKE